MSNGVLNEDWISLSLGGGAAGTNGDTSTQNGLNSGLQIAPRDLAREGAANTNMDDAASLLLGMNDARSDKSSRQRSDSPFSFPRQKRSVRPRLKLGGIFDPHETAVDVQGISILRHLHRNRAADMPCQHIYFYPVGKDVCYKDS
ncbi:E3 SUMO-protein ligase [Arachis hypogaea]|nr:E3 SUMO-protein ligase [Arachis hypogaea]